MRKTLVVATGLTIFSVTGAGAQGLSNQCTSGQIQAQDACQQAYDLYQFMAPQLGISLSGGNATLGTGSTLGGLGHFSIGVRGNIIQGSLPQVNQFTQSTTGAQSKSLPTKDQILGLPTADAAIGIFAGLPLALTNILGIDALVSASYVPTVSDNTFSVTPDQNVQVGYGVRVGILSESIVVPGVSFTYLKRDLPTTTLSGTSSSGNALRVQNLKVNTTAWRVVASKSLLLFSFAVGAGKDMYDQSANITGTVTQSGIVATSTVAATQSLDRTNYFGDIALNLPLFKIVAEAGQVTGGTVNTFNSFSGGRADKDLPFYSLGVRLSF